MDLKDLPNISEFDQFLKLRKELTDIATDRLYEIMRNDYADSKASDKYHLERDSVIIEDNKVTFSKVNYGEDSTDYYSEGFVDFLIFKDDWRYAIEEQRRLNIEESNRKYFENQKNIEAKELKEYEKLKQKYGDRKDV